MSSRPTRPTRGRWLIAGLLLSGMLATATPNAGADPMGDAQAQAAALRTKVDQLRQQAEVVTEAYNAAYEQLGEAVSAHLTAQRQLDAAQQASGGAADAASRRIRALYMSGGVPALYAGILRSGSITEVAQRVHQVDVVLGTDRRAADQANATLVAQQNAELALARTAAEATRLQKTVSAKADAVTTMLGQADALLAAADQRVRDLAEQQRQAAEAAAAAKAAAALAQLGPDSGQALPPVAASPRATAALAFAQQQLGKPYLWGGTGPASWDCSGLTQAAYRAAGLTLLRTAAQQWDSGPHVGLADLEPGDLLFWANDLANPSSIHHVALYAGQGLMVAAPHSGDVVKIQPIYLEGYIGAVRPGGTLSGPVTSVTG